MTTQDLIRRGGMMLCAACAAYAVTDLIVALVVGYPSYPPPKVFHIDDRLGEFKDLAWESPHARIWNVEAGGTVHEYNNVGLSGNDVRTGLSSRYIFVVGDSYVEALQVPPEDAATSVFQRALDSAGQDYQVLNLGRGKLDPYASWYRVKFFERSYRPAYVILVMEQFYAKWMADYTQPLRFDIQESFGTEVPRTGLHALLGELRMTSALWNMLAVGYYSKEPADLILESPNKETDIAPPIDRDLLTDPLRSCLRRFHEEYGSRFIAVSIGRNPGRDSLMTDFCRKEGIACETDRAITLPQNHIAGIGHLNRRGNYALGKFLFETYCKHCLDR